MGKGCETPRLRGAILLVGSEKTYPPLKGRSLDGDRVTGLPWADFSGFQTPARAEQRKPEAWSSVGLHLVSKVGNTRRSGSVRNGTGSQAQLRGGGYPRSNAHGSAHFTEYIDN